MLQGCGDDTGGALTVVLDSSQIAETDFYKVSAEITYTPPAGKSAQGVEVTYVVKYLDATQTLVTATGTKTLTSNSNSFVLLDAVSQFADATNSVSIVASVGSMTASSFALIPKIKPVVVTP